MAVSDTLFTAILAMDAYNRGDGAGVGGLSQEVGNTIGDASIIGSMQDASSGFYAVAYSWNGQTVISYRGTDNLNILDGSNDILNGWVQGAGILSAQATDAEAFYNSITGRTIFDGMQPNVLLTGHSLGGGLAGYIGAITGDNALIFDNMPYAQSAVNRVVLEDIGDGFTNFNSLLFGTATAPAALPTGRSITSLYTSGEVLAAVRAAGPALAAPLMASFLTGAFLAAGTGTVSAPLDAGAAVGVASVVNYDESQLPTLNAYSGTVFLGLSSSPVELHSVALLVLLEYARENGFTAWQSIGPDLTTSYFNDALGNAIALLPGGVAGAAAQTLTEIAYSALTEGTMPFGDTGIAALFHDADQLGTVYSSDSTALVLSGVESALTDSIVEYAGNLARNSDTLASHASGIINANTANDSLRIDFSPSSWTIAGSEPTILGKNELLSDLNAAGLSPSGFAAADFTDPTYDYVYIGTNDTSIHTIDAAADAGSDLIVADGGTDNIVVGTGKTDVIGGSGTDTIDASSLTAGGVVQLEAGSGPDNVTMGSSATLVLDNPAEYSGTITGFVEGDTIDLADIGTATMATIDNNVLSVGGTDDDINLALGQSFDYTGQTAVVAPDGNGGTDVTLTPAMTHTITFSEFPVYTENPVYTYPDNTVNVIGEIVEDGAQPASPAVAANTSYTGPVFIDFTNPVTHVDFNAGYFNDLGSTTVTFIGPGGAELQTSQNTQYGIVPYSYDNAGGISAINVVNTGYDESGFSVDTIDFSGSQTSTAPSDATYGITTTNAVEVPDDPIFTFTVTRSGDVSAASSVGYAVTGTGNNPLLATDLPNGTFPVGQVSFAAGESTQTITVDVLGNFTPTNPKTFAVTLLAPSAGTTIGGAASTDATTLPPPVISGTAAGQQTTDTTAINPFTGVAITDPNSGQTETLTVTLSAAANGALTDLGSGSYNATTGVYTDTGTAAGVTSDLDGLAFTPTTGQVPTGQNVTTGLMVKVVDSSAAVSSDSTTTVVAAGTMAVPSSPPPNSPPAQTVTAPSSPVTVPSTPTQTDTGSGTTESATPPVVPPAPPVFATPREVTDTPTVSVSGTAAAGGTVTLTEGSAPVATAMADPLTGAFSATVPVALGGNTLSASVTTSAGTSAASSIVIFDVPAPVSGVSTTTVSSADLNQALSQGASLQFAAGTESVVLTDGILSVGQDTNEAATDRLFIGLLGHPDNNPASLGFTDQSLAGGNTQSGLAAGILNSAEYASQHGNSTDAQFVQLLYQNALGRSADTTPWTNLLAGGVSRADVAVAITSSPEAKAYLASATSDVFAQDANGTLINELFVTGLGQEVGSSGLAGLKAALAGITPSMFVQELTTTPAFLALHGGQSDSDYVTSLYQNGLGRAPDGGTLSAFTGLLSTGTLTRADVLLGIATSSEAAARLTANV